MTGVRTSPPCRPACLGHLTPNAPPRKWARRRYVFCIVPRSVTVASIRSLKRSSRYTFPLFKLLCGFSCVIGPRPTQNRGQKYLRGHTAPLPAGLFAFGVQNETALDHCLLDHRPCGRLRVCTERFPCRCTYWLPYLSQLTLDASASREIPDLKAPSLTLRCLPS